MILDLAVYWFALFMMHLPVGPALILCDIVFRILCQIKSIKSATGVVKMINIPANSPQYKMIYSGPFSERTLSRKDTHDLSFIKDKKSWLHVL